MAQEYKEKQPAKAAETETATEPVDLSNPDLTEDVDDLLDEIDEVLEENAQEFVANYIQKGGE